MSVSASAVNGTLAPNGVVAPGSAKPSQVQTSKSARHVSVMDEEASLWDVLQILSRQRWLIAFFAAAGLAAGVAYALNARLWYTSTARVLINQKSSGLAGKPGDNGIDEEVLANHVELLLSPKIVGEGLAAGLDDPQYRDLDLMELPSVVEHLDRDNPESTKTAVDYVISHMDVEKGGEGGARDARTLTISLSHTDPDDAKLLLDAVVLRYQVFLNKQIADMTGAAMDKVGEAKGKLSEELELAEKAHLEHRLNAPLMFQGEGSSNVYQDKYRRLQDELVNIDIEESSVRTRLEQVRTTLKEMDQDSENPMDNLDKLALIDSESLERLGAFAGLQLSASNSPEFKAMMPARAEEANTKFGTLLRLNSEKKRLTAKFGPNHPDVQEVEDSIQLVTKFIENSEQESAMDRPFGDQVISPAALLKTYTGFLYHDLATFDERRKELEALAADAESNARNLIEHELTDSILQNRIARAEALFEGLVQQIRDMDTASALNGFLYEFLSVPNVGKRTWPKLSICGLGGLMLGLCSGLCLAVANDIRDGRFRSAAELSEVVQMPSLGRVGKLNSMRSGIRGVIAAELSPDAEAFRLARTMLLPAVRSGELTAIGVTSPMQGDGKSTITSNLAACFAQVDLRVLVIDGDLRRPTMHRYFSVVPESGLCEVLQGQLNADEAVKTTELPGVSVITAGASTSTPAELLQSDQLNQLVDRMKTQFDLVIVDMPPVLAVSDPVVVAPKLDGVVLVVRAATARKDEVVNSIRRINSAGGEFAGCVLNIFGSGKKFADSGGYYGYYESDYTRRRVNTNAKPVRTATPGPVSAK